MPEATGMKVVDIKPVVNERVVALIEEMLGKAKAGDIVGFAGVFQYKDEHFETCARGDLGTRMLGELAVLQDDILRYHRAAVPRDVLR
jgi:hypothetical protein